MPRYISADGLIRSARRPKPISTFPRPRDETAIGSGAENQLLLSQAHHVGRGTEEDCHCPPGEVGEDTVGAEESGVTPILQTRARQERAFLL